MAGAAEVAARVSATPGAPPRMGQGLACHFVGYSEKPEKSLYFLPAIASG